MKTGSVSHPEKDPLTIIRQWQLDFCDGSHVAASLLSFFEYWHDHKAANVEKYSKQNKMLKEHGEDYRYDVSLLQFQTEEDIESGVLFLFKKDSIRKGIKLLEDKGILEIHSNPNKKYSFDKKRYFLFKPEVANKYIMERKIEVSKTENRSSSPENRPSSTENQSTITETSSEITYREVISYFFNLKSLETDASVREAFENADPFLKEGKYLALLQSKDGTSPILGIKLPGLRSIFAVSYEQMSKLSFSQLCDLISPLNNVCTYEPFREYYTKIDDVRVRKGDELASAAGMGETPQPSKDMKEQFNL